MKILNFGSCNIDCVYDVAHFVNPGETIKSSSVKKFPGGKGLNQTIAIARSGTDVCHAGCIGADGEFLRELLELSGASTTYLKTVDTMTGHAIIQVDKDGENSIIICLGANGEIDKPFIDWVLSDFEKDDIIVLQNEISNLNYIIDLANEKGIRIVLNPSPFDESIKSIDLNKLWLLILNKIEGSQWCGGAEPYLIIKHFKENYKSLQVVLTLGSKGSIYSSNLEQHFCPSFKVTPVDTTGAGDTFTGYFVSGLFKGESVEDALRFASAASAIAITKMGAARAVPTLSEVKAALTYLEPNSENVDFLLDSQISTVKSYIKNNLSTVAAEDIANLLGYNVCYTSSWIKKHIGSNLTDLIMKYKLQKIAKLLIETDLPISEIIAQVGYKNETFIRTAFVKKYGLSFKEYRKNNSASPHNK